MTTRRSLIHLLGLAPAAPLAAKMAVDKEIAKLSGVMGEGAAPAAHYGACMGGTPVQSISYGKLRIAASQYAKSVGLPEFVLEQLRRNSSYVGVLDPDLAAKRSWSMCVKIAEQRERNLARAIEQFEFSGRYEKASMAFKALTGWDWPW
jgi:hypothetical protein